MKVIQEGNQGHGKTTQGFQGTIAPAIYRDGHCIALGVRKGTEGRRPASLLYTLPADISADQLAILGMRWIVFMEKLRDQGVLLDEMLGRAAWFASNTKPDPVIESACKDGERVMRIHLKRDDVVEQIRSMRPV